jgi:hypothetical protein
MVKTLVEGNVKMNSVDGKKNTQLHNAKRDKQDEFYTQLSDIEYELKHYKQYFKDKIVLCNCDDPEESMFWLFFYLKFKDYGLKKLIATHYDSEKSTYKLECRDGVNKVKTNFKGNGDFRSKECIDLLKEADIVVTNPPFSLFREYVAQLFDYNKDFLIIGNKNAITYKEIFSLFKENKIWLGHCSPEKFSQPSTATVKSLDGLTRWFTNLAVSKRHDNIILRKPYNEMDYPKYDNYDAINVNKTKDIPVDYNGKMGVPITFMDKYNPEQFEIIKFRKGDDEKDLTIGGKTPYFRIVIKRRVSE